MIYDVGMVVFDWLGIYGYNMYLFFMYDWFFGLWDLFIEYGY